MYVIVILCKTKKIHKLKTHSFKKASSPIEDEGPPFLFTPPPSILLLLGSTRWTSSPSGRCGSSLSLLPPPFLTYAVLRVANVFTREPLVV